MHLRLPHHLHIHLRPFLRPLHHQLEIINIESRRKRIEELRFLIKWIREGVRSANADGNVVAGFGVDGFVVFDVEANGALGYEEGLVVHFMPVGWGAGGVRWDGEDGGRETVIWV